MRGDKVKLWGRVVAGVVIGSVALAGTAAGSVATKAKKVSPEKYAKTVCGSQLDLASVLDDFATDFNGIAADDPVAFQTDALALTDDLLSDITSVQSKLKKQYPDVDDGKKIGKVFVANIDEILTAVGDAREEFAAADATGVAFAADVSSFGVAFQVLSATLSDPFSEITDQDLLGAFDDEKTCEEVVTIF